MKSKSLFSPLRSGLALAGLLVLSLSGCATIVGNNQTTVGIRTVPPGAHLVVTDVRGHRVFHGMAPARVVLPKSTGRYWGGETYRIRISLAGFKSEDVTLKARPNGWYLFGNLVFGGAIGWFAIDPWNGAMYTLHPEALESHARYQKHTLLVTMIEDVPAKLRKRMVKVGQLARD